MNLKIIKSTWNWDTNGFIDGVFEWYTCSIVVPIMLACQ